MYCIIGQGCGDSFLYFFLYCCCLIISPYARVIEIFFNFLCASSTLWNV